MWESASYRDKLRILEGESSVMIGLLIEDETLVAMIRRGNSKELCLAYINENF